MALTNRTKKITKKEFYPIYSHLLTRKAFFLFIHIFFLFSSLIIYPYTTFCSLPFQSATETVKICVPYNAVEREKEK